jgi:hypothetical protein
MPSALEDRLHKFAQRIQEYTSEDNKTEQPSKSQWTEDIPSAYARDAGKDDVIAKFGEGVLSTPTPS